MHKVTIEDISRHTGLSRGTVSRALNDRPDISEQTKHRVLEACQQLKYVPSHAARSLATGRRYAVAVLVDDLRSQYSGCYLRGAGARARAQQYTVHVSELGSEPERAIDHVRSLLAERVDSLLIATPVTADVARQLAEVAAGKPLVVTVGAEGVSADLIGPDYVEAGRLAARHLLRVCDPGKLLYAHEPGTIEAEKQRQGFEEVCQQAGVDPGSVIVEVPPRGGGNEAARLDGVRGRLADARAVAVTTDVLALELILVAYAQGRHAGRDYSIMGYGNALFGGRITPGLTTVDYVGEEIGQRAMDIALARISKTRQDTFQQVLVPPVLVQRETTPAVQ